MGFCKVLGSINAPWGQVTKMDSVRGQELSQIFSNYMATVTKLGTVCGCEGQVDASEIAVAPCAPGRRLELASL